MDFTLGDALIVAVPAGILLAVIWAVSQAFRPRDFGISDAERYQRELARRSAEHQAQQVQAALAARARAAAATPHRQNLANHQGPQARPGPATSAPASAGTKPGTGAFGSRAPAGGLPAVLPTGQLNPEFVRQLQSLARNGQKIQAIKLLRDYTHADLRSAKNYIDRL